MAIQHYRPETYRVTEAVGYLLRRAHKLALARAEDAFTGEELSFIHWISLVLIRDGLVDTCGALARCLDHNNGATTRTLDQLEERGLILRHRSTTDRRVVHLALTDAGLAAANRLVPRIVKVWNDLLADFDAAEFETLTRLLLRLIARLDAMTVERDGE